MDIDTGEADVLEHKALVKWFVHRELKAGRVHPWEADDFEAEVWLLGCELAAKWDGRIPFGKYFAECLRTSVHRTERARARPPYAHRRQVLFLANRFVEEQMVATGVRPSWDEVRAAVTEQLVVQAEARLGPGLSAAERRELAVGKLHKSGALRAVRRLEHLVGERGWHASLDSTLSEEGEDTFGETFADGAPDVDELAFGDDTTALFEQWVALAGLTAWEEEVLRNEFAEADEARTLTELGVAFGVSRETPRNWLKAARAKLLHPTVLAKLEVG